MASTQAIIKIRDKKTVVIYYRNHRWSLGITVDCPTKEDEEKMIRNNQLTSHYKGAKAERDELNKLIANKLSHFNTLITEALNKNKDTLDYLYANFKEEARKLKSLRINANTPIDEAFKIWVESKKKQLHKERSIQRYENEVSRLSDYQKIKKTVVSDIDLDCIIDFTKYLAKPFKKTYANIKDSHFEREYKVTKELSQSNSTIKRFVTDLCSCLKAVQLKEPQLKFPFDEIYRYMRTLKTPKMDKETIVALDKKRWEAYKAFKPDPKKDWEWKTYWLYYFCVKTGLRYSDATLLYDIYVDEQNYISMKASKTGSNFKVKMDDTALYIFNLFNRNFRNKFPVNQQINKNLRKILTKIPEFNEETMTYDYVLGKITPKPIKWSELMTFHSSRRSFVGFLIRNNPKITFDAIQKMTGWTDISTLNSYLEIYGDHGTDGNIAIDW